MILCPFLFLTPWATFPNNYSHTSLCHRLCFWGNPGGDIQVPVLGLLLTSFPFGSDLLISLLLLPQLKNGYYNATQALPFDNVTYVSVCFSPCTHQTLTRGFFLFLPLVFVKRQAQEACVASWLGKPYEERLLSDLGSGEKADQRSKE